MQLHWLRAYFFGVQKSLNSFTLTHNSENVSPTGLDSEKAFSLFPERANLAFFNQYDEEPHDYS